jgi:hypothetical protein
LRWFQARPVGSPLNMFNALVTMGWVGG